VIGDGHLKPVDSIRYYRCRLSKGDSTVTIVCSSSCHGTLVGLLYRLIILHSSERPWSSPTWTVWIAEIRVSFGLTIFKLEKYDTVNPNFWRDRRGGLLDVTYLFSEDIFRNTISEQDRGAPFHSDFGRNSTLVKNLKLKSARVPISVGRDHMLVLMNWLFSQDSLTSLFRSVDRGSWRRTKLLRSRCVFYGVSSTKLS